jgi:ferritin-like metal-binding protein YciE
MPDALNTRDTKLVQWLNEAYTKEAELEADLTAHIAMTKKDAYRKRLQAHLKETRDHKKRVGQRIKALGGTATSGPGKVPGVPGAVGELTGKAVAAVKGQVGTARAALTGEVETHLRNAQEELREEHVEIALYRRIETFSAAVGDRETEQLAKQITRDEERMAKFLDAEIVRLVKELVRTEVPREERAQASPARRRSSSSSSRRTGTSTSRRSSTRGTTARSRRGSQAGSGRRA